MDNRNRIESPECQRVQTLLSDYMENTLSARDAWNVEKHLAVCPPCTQFLHEMQATVSLLRTAPRRDTSNDFMARLHAQLDSVEPTATRPMARFAAWRDRIADFGGMLRNPRLLAPGLSLSAVALAAVLVVNQFTPATQPAANPVGPTQPTTAASTQTLNHNVALSASNPFDDPAAANLEAQSQTESNEPNAENENSGS